MSNPIYSAMAGQQPGIMSAVQSLKQNPIQFLMQRKFNVPANIANDPNAIIQHLMNTGQVSQQQYNKAMEKIGQLR